MVRSHKPDVMLLDLMLPKLGGLEVIKRLRVDDPDTPVIVLSAKDQEGDKVLALSLGADDYVTKPFSIVEVIARLRVALRRRRRAKAGGGGGEATTASARCSSTWPGGASSSRAAEVESTAREFDLLAFLHTHPGTVFSREQLMQQVWGPEPLRHRAHRRQLHRPAARQDRRRSRSARSTSRRCAAWAIASTRDGLQCPACFSSSDRSAKASRC